MSKISKTKCCLNIMTDCPIKPRLDSYASFVTSKIALIPSHQYLLIQFQRHITRNSTTKHNWGQLKKKMTPLLQARSWILMAIAVTISGHGAAAFRVVAFSTAEQDLGHISFVNEANEWFPPTATRYNFSFQSTRDWSLLNDQFLSTVDVVIFLDTRPENPAHRRAFENYMNSGRGAWLGFHFSAFALTPSAYPQNWDWYHNTFLGSGEYWSNTWKPTPAFLRVENASHPATRNLPTVFASQANEWYRWQRSLVDDPNIEILASIDPSSFPLGTGPNPGEIWWDGYYPMVWTNRNYKMIYMNMGHNDIDYSNGNAQASWTFGGEIQNRLIIDSILWLAGQI